VRKFVLTLALAALAFVPAVARAQCGGSASTSDYRCTNQCPLAKQANLRRAKGTEACATSDSVRNAVAKTVARNLDRI
jgi:hypothetical protein